MKVSHLSNSVRSFGRWAKREDALVTTALGSYLELAFTGKWCDLSFDTKLNSEPYPHLYIQVDGGAKTEVRVEPFIRIETPQEGNHVVKITYKSAMEDQQRWFEPLVGKISFTGFEADGEGVLPEDNRKIIEFIGDSITEGTWANEERAPFPGGYNNHNNMVFQNDSTATYACLTAEALGMKPYTMGYGAVGLTKGGSGGVPRVYEAYPYIFNNVERVPSGAEIIVINHGANDYDATEEEYITAYEEFIKLVRKINPDAEIVALSAYIYRYNKALGEMVKKYNKENDDSVLFVDTDGWIPKDPIHPTREGHKTVSKNLVPILKEAFF